MNEAFFERLYRGYAAEHLVASQLYHHAYEVFRLPADFGLDLVVTNQFMVARRNNASAEYFPFALQVKSRWLKTEDTVTGPSGRPETTVTFQLKSTELDLIVSHKKAGVVFVAYVPVEENKRYDSFYFWLHGEQLRAVRDAGFLLADQDQWQLTVRYRRLPQHTREAFVQEIEDECTLTVAAKQKLLKELPATFLRNWKASDYLAFARKARDGTNTLVFKTVWNVPMTFDNFPVWLEIGGFD
jgi:hypothetical protein